MCTRLELMNLSWCEFVPFAIGVWSFDSGEVSIHDAWSLEPYS